MTCIWGLNALSYMSVYKIILKGVVCWMVASTITQTGAMF